MKPGPYAASIQWGAGHHYFIYPRGSTKEEILVEAKAHIERLKAYKKKRGAAPRAYVWKKIEELI